MVERIEEHAVAAERRDDLWLDQLDLLPEVAFARLDLVRQGVTVAGRTAFQGVTHEDIAARESDAREQRVEELPRLADERDALLVLVEAGRLSDEHQVCLRVPRAEDDLCPALGEPALRAARNGVGEDGELVHSRGIY